MTSMKVTMSKSSLCWIYGNQRQSKQTWQRLLDSVEKRTGEPPNVEVLLCGFNSKGATDSQRWCDTNGVINILRNRDMFDTRPRIIKLCGLPEGYTEIVHYLDIINKNNMLAICGPFGYIKPGTKRFITAKTTKLFKTIKSKGMVIEHDLEVRNIGVAARWVVEVAEEEGKKMDVETSRYLAERQGLNLDILHQSVIKLATYQTSKTITKEDVDACCPSEFLNDVWGYLDNLDNKECDPALAYMQQFYEEGDGSVGESFYGRVSKFFGALLQHFQFLMMSKDASGNTINARDIELAAKNFYKATPSKIKELIAGNITKQDLEARFSSGYLRMNLDKSSVKTALQNRKGILYSVLLDVYRCMLLCRVKSGSPAYIKLCLDTFTLMACGKITLDDAARMRGHEAVLLYNRW